MTSVTLKKAYALMLALTSCPVVIHHQFSVDPFGDPPKKDTLEDCAKRFEESVTLFQKKIEAVATIRALIGKANEGRVNELLSTRAAQEKFLAAIKDIPIRDKDSNLTALARKMEQAKEAKESAYGRKDQVVLEINTSNVLTPLIKALKKAKIKVDDELASYNFRTEIELPDSVVEVLTHFDLI